MKRIYTLLFVFAIGISFLQAETKVLFIGNSFSAPVPDYLKEIVRSSGDTITVGLNWDGQTLEQQLSSPMTIQNIQSEDWDYVVIQENSAIGGFDPGWEEGYFEYYSYNAAKAQNDSIKANNPCTKTVFYMTWGYQNGDQNNFPGDTYLAQQMRIRRNYMLLANDFDAIVSPVGIVWKEMRAAKPWINLYDPDNYHPNQYGSYISACTFYSVFFDRSPEGLYLPPEVDDSTGKFIQEKAWDIVLDSSDKWRINISHPNAAPTGFYPVNRRVVTELDVTFDWEELALANSYHFQLSEVQDFSTLEAEQTGIGPSSISGTLANMKTEYFWRVRAEYLIGDTLSCNTAWSKPYQFTTPFDGPALLEPENGGTCQALLVYLEWNEFNNQELYRLQISTDTLFGVDDRVVTRIANPGTSFEYLLPNEMTKYFWRVQVDEGDPTTNWSEIRSFTTGFAPPEIVYPKDSTTAVYPIDIPFDFESGTDISTFILQISKDYYFTNTYYEDQGTSSSFTVTVADFYTEFYWRVKQFSDGCVSDWSEPTYFRTIIPTPVIISPLDTTEKQPLSIEFLWDSEFDNDFYEVSVAEDFEYKDILFGQSGIPTKKVTVKDFEPNKTYYWKVRAGYDKEWSHWTESATFTTGEEMPDKVALTFPENESTMLPLEFNFEWETGENVVYYSLEFSNLDSFDELISSADSLTSTTFSISELENYETYYWRVKGLNSQLEGVWSDIWSFRTIAELPGVSTLETPQNGVTGLNPKEVVFSFSEVEFTDRYYLQIAKDDEFSDLGIDDDQITEATYIVNDLDPETELFWHVAAINEAGQGAWSETYSFTTDSITAVDELNFDETVNAYPNPNTGVFFIENPDHEISQIAVIDISGNTVYKSNPLEFTETALIKIDLGNLEPGTFILRINKAGRIIVSKMIIK